MRISLHDISVLAKPNQQANEIKQVKEFCGAKACGRDIARSNELHVAAAIAKFGHLRTAEIARAVWPSARWAEQMALRTCSRMLTKGYILARRNALGGTSYVLTRSGAGWLSLHGIEARHTLELSSVGGATFIHRTLGSRFLIEHSIKDGAGVMGEYGIANGHLPFSISRLTKTLKKLPDGIVWQTEASGYKCFKWVEVENAAKPKSELRKILTVATYSGQIVDAEQKAALGGLIIVFDGALNHPKRLISAADELWGDKPKKLIEQFENSISLASVEIRAPLFWSKYTSMTLHEFRKIMR